MTDDDWVTGRWTYKGRRFDHRSKKVLHLFASESGDVLYSKAPQHASIGAIYEVEHNSEGTARIRSAAFVERAAIDDQALSEWRAEDLAARNAYEANNARRRMAKENSDLGALTLGQVRDLICKQPAHLRAGTIAAVVQFID